MSQTFEELVTAALDGKLTADQHAALAALLKGSPVLRAEYVRQIRTGLALSERLAPAVVVRPSAVRRWLAAAGILLFFGVVVAAVVTFIVPSAPSSSAETTTAEVLPVSPVVVTDSVSVCASIPMVAPSIIAAKPAIISTTSVRPRSVSSHVNVAESLSAAGAFFAASAAGSATAFDASGYSHKIAFLASGYAGTSVLTNFPVLVRLSPALIEGFSYADFKSPDTGADLRFVGSEGSGLPFEIDSWDTNGTSLIWVKVPELTASTSLTAYYGNAAPADAPAASNVWSSYAGVWHLGDADSSGLSHDSGPFAIDGINDAATTAVTDGVVGVCRRISGTDRGVKGGGILVPGYTNLAANSSSVFTVGGWIRHKRDQAPYWDHVFYKRAAGDEPTGFCSEFYDSYWAVDVYGAANDGDHDDSRAWLPGSYGAYEWVHFVLVYSNASVSAYADGVRILATERTPVIANNYPLAFGTSSMNDDCNFKGEMDELRVTPVACSADWIAAEYAVVASNADFLAASPAVPTDANIPVFASVAHDVTPKAATLQATLLSTGGGTVTLTCSFGTSPTNLVPVETWTGITTNGGVYAHVLTGLQFATAYYYSYSAVCDGTSACFCTTNSFTTGSIVTWTGAAGTTDWSDADNWDGGFVPSALADVVIPAGIAVGVTGSVAAASVSLEAGSTSLRFAASASLAVGGAFSVTGPGTCELSGGSLAVGGDFVCGYSSGGVAMTVSDMVLSASDLYIGYLRNGSGNSLVVTNAAASISNLVAVGLACSTPEPASSNLLLVAKGGLLTAQYAYVATDWGPGTALEDRFVIDGGIVTNTAFLLAQRNYQSTLGGYLDVRNGGHLELTASWGNTPGLYFRASGGGDATICGISVVDGGEIHSMSRIVYGSSACKLGTPYFAVTNGTVFFGYQTYMQGAGRLALAGAGTRFSTEQWVDYGGSFELAVPPEGWKAAPFRFSNSVTVGDATRPLVVDASGYAGVTSATIPLLQATKAGVTIPAAFVTGATISLPGRKWQGELVFNSASNSLSLKLTAPPGFVIRICDAGSTLPLEWIHAVQPFASASSVFRGKVL